jgi:hypothetical protein
MTNKKRALELLRKAGQEFVADFLSAYNGAIPLRSKEPGLCWKAAGQVAFAVINEFAGPNAMEDDAPLLLRLRTNSYPPPAIHYHLKSPAVRHKLGVVSDPLIANEPVLELTALPEEIGKFGRWLTTWLDSQFYQRFNCPTPPIPLVAWSVNDDLTSRKDAVEDMGAEWRQHLYLWTNGALEVFEPWLQK